MWHKASNFFSSCNFHLKHLGAQLLTVSESHCCGHSKSLQILVIPVKYVVSLCLIHTIARIELYFAALASLIPWSSNLCSVFFLYIKI